MNALMETIIQGWSDSIKDLPTDVRVFWSFRDELAVEDGIIFKENNSSSQRVCAQTFLPNSISLTKALKRPNYWPEKGCTGQTSTKTLNI